MTAKQPRPPILVSRAEALTALKDGARASRTEILTSNEGMRGSRDPNWLEHAGQSAGPPGQGPEPPLVHQPGGEVVQGLLHPAFKILNETYRALPEESWFDPTVSPQKPVQFELGAFTVPADEQFWMFDYEFAVFRQSGVDAADILRAEEGRFSGVLGFDIKFTGRRLSHLLFQLDPVPVVFARQTFETPTVSFPFRRDVSKPSQFVRSAVQSFAANASPGLSLLPVTSQRYGPRDAPFTLIAQQGDRVSLSCVIFRPIPSPVSAIEGSIRGYLIHTQISSALINRMRPR